MWTTMTSGSIFPLRLTKIDALTLPDHSYLTAEDTCYFLGEYTARKGFAFSATNGVVLNFKKPVSKRPLPEWQYKEQAIARVGAAFRNALNVVTPAQTSGPASTALISVGSNARALDWAII